MQRLVAFDTAKAICIVLVVVGHYAPDYSPAWYMGVHDVIYAFHMPLFMFASGFVYNATRRDISYTEFLGKKFRRLIVPYFVTSFIIITIKLSMQGNAYMENPVTVMSYLSVFWSPSAGYFLWFVLALWWMFVLVPLFKTVKSRMLLFLMAVVFYMLPFDLPHTLCLSEFKRMLLYFMLGVVCFDNKHYISFERHKWSGALLFVTFFILGRYESIIGGGNWCLNVLTASAGILMIMQLSHEIEARIPKKGLALFTSISVSSYIIYLFHTTFEGFAKSVIHKIPAMSTAGNEPLFVVGAVIVISCGTVAPVLLHKYVLSRTRITRVLFGLK